MKLDNPNFKDKELLATLCELFNGKDEAMEFIVHYGQYIETVDDMIDEPFTEDRVRLLTAQAATVFNLAYWKKWSYALYAVERLIHNTYFDSVKWQKAEEEWKRRDAKCMSHAGYNMLFAIILLEFGEAKLEELSLRFRHHAHERHLEDKI
jgi:hypothetical protein